MMGTKQDHPCGDCDDGHCTMNCGPARPSPLAARAANAVAFLRKPAAPSERIPNTVRQSCADVIEELLARVEGGDVR